MWPLFAPAWSLWRQQRLQLPAVPLTGCSKLPPPTQLLYGISDAVHAAAGWWPSSVHMCGFWQPKVTAVHSSASLQGVLQWGDQLPSCACASGG